MVRSCCLFAGHGEFNTLEAGSIPLGFVEQLHDANITFCTPARPVCECPHLSIVSGQIGDLMHIPPHLLVVYRMHEHKDTRDMVYVAVTDDGVLLALKAGRDLLPELDMYRRMLLYCKKI
jgi:hypothetical protein